MKYGVRKPSVKKSISARTKGRVTRTVKGAINPTYGKKGMGWVNDPGKAAYNKVYNQTTWSATQLPTGIANNRCNGENSEVNMSSQVGCGCLGCLVFIGAIPGILLVLLLLWVMFIISPILGMLLLLIVMFIVFFICFCLI